MLTVSSIAQAKTGTGKTLAFLMPIVQRILKDRALERRSYGQADVDIRALIISPTRELAEQIAVEAKKVVSATDVRVQTAVGGSAKREGLQRIRREGCHILVGTPGRIKDVVSDPYSGVDLQNIEVFVLDEADRLLDIGFAPEIEEIQSYMPPRSEKDRQTLMFSATVPRSVVGLVKQTLRPDFKFIRTSNPNETPTHERVPQKVVIARGLENRLPAIFELAYKSIKAHEEDPENNMPFKAILYFGSTSEVSLSHEIFQNMRGSVGESSSSRFRHPLAPAEIIEMHSKLTQQQRTRNSARFRTAKSALLFSSDVTSRGMDFPDVSHVIQLGLPNKEDDYIHRLGRTGRAGKPGQGWLIIQDQNLREFKRGLGAELPIQKDDSLKTASLDMKEPSNIPSELAGILQMVHDGVKATPYMTKAQAYMSMFGVLKQAGYRDSQDMVDALNNLARYGWALEELPPVPAALASKLSLGRVSGLNIQSRSSFDDRRGGLSDRGRGGQDSFLKNRDPFAQDEEFGGRGGGGYGGGSRDRGDFGRGSYGGGSRDRGGFGGRGGFNRDRF